MIEVNFSPDSFDIMTNSFRSNFQKVWKNDTHDSNWNNVSSVLYFEKLKSFENYFKQMIKALLISTYENEGEKQNTWELKKMYQNNTPTVQKLIEWTF